MEFDIFSKKNSSPVFLFSSISLLVFVFISLLSPTKTEAALNLIQNFLIKNLSWLYILSVATIFLAAIYFGTSRFSDVRLGPDHSVPRFSYFSWFAMLFSAGMGIGIMFFGVAEPIMHFSSPAIGPGGTTAAAKESLSITFFHWGFHAWSIYALVGLVLAYFSYRHHLPLTLRSALYPLIGKKIYGPIGHAFDVFAILGTIFGVAASLGYGVTQISSGLEIVAGWESTPFRQIILIIAVTFIATASAVSGVEKGVKKLSEINLILAVTLLFLVLFLGPTNHLFSAFLQNVGNYLSSVVHKTFNLYAYENSQKWLGGWTLLYWAWWLSWSPFVGMFIAKISYGRTIREFILGVILIPSLFNFIWMTVFGNSALNLIIHGGANELVLSTQSDVASSLFVFLSFFPLYKLTSIIAIFMVVVFFITSADSGALVVNLLASGGDDKNSSWQKIYWSLLIGLVAIVVFLAGGLESLQTATILSALPFSVILLLSIFGLKKALDVDYLKRSALGNGANMTTSLSNEENWRKRINLLVNTPKFKQIQSFINSVVARSFSSVSKEFEKQGMNVKIKEKDDGLLLLVHHGQEVDFLYRVAIREFEPPSFTLTQKQENKAYYRAEVFLKEGGQNYEVMGYTEEQIIADILDQYEKHLHFLSLIR